MFEEVTMPGSLNATRRNRANTTTSRTAMEGVTKTMEVRKIWQ